MGDKDGLITGQRINPVKAERARAFRRRMTPMEQKLWGRLRNNQLGGYHFRRQQVIAGFIIDYYCNPLRLAVEVDGKVHDYYRESDAERESILRSMGIRVLRVTNEAIDRDIETVLQRILSHCRKSVL